MTVIDANKAEDILLCSHGWIDERDKELALEIFYEDMPKFEGKEDVHAHWTLEVIFPSEIRWYRCSRCGRRIRFCPTTDKLSRYPYCHCGAKMDEEIEE